MSSPTTPVTPASSSVVVDARPRQSLRHQDQASAEVKKEARVIARVKELKERFLWAGGEAGQSGSGSGLRALAKPAQQEPQGPKPHWGYVLEEMGWMANIFQVREARNIVQRQNHSKLRLIP